MKNITAFVGFLANDISGVMLHFLKLQFRLHEVCWRGRHSRQAKEIMA
jgi:hypothetical protein